MKGVFRIGLPEEAVVVGVIKCVGGLGSRGIVCVVLTRQREGETRPMAMQVPMGDMLEIAQDEEMPFYSSLF